LVAAAEELRVGADDRRFERTDGVILDFGAHEAADLHAGLRARNEIKAVAVKRTNSYVLYYLGLDRDFRRVRADDGDKPGDAAEQKTSRVHVSPRSIELFFGFDAFAGPPPKRLHQSHVRAQRTIYNRIDVIESLQPNDAIRETKNFR
jgi:hypothetical protein